MLSEKEKRQAFSQMTYREIFDSILCLEREQYVNAPIDVREAIFQAWMERDEAAGFLDYEILNNIEESLGIKGRGWKEEKQRLFVDMDGTLAVFKPCRHLETLYERGYFESLMPLENVLDAVRIHAQEDNFDIYVLSAYLGDSPYALTEKNRWLDTYLPEIDKDHRIFCECGQDKSIYIPGGVRENDCLLDDYSVNLFQWKRAGGRGIKLMNGINGTKGTWQGARVDSGLSPEVVAAEIEKTMRFPGIQKRPVQKQRR